MRLDRPAQESLLLELERTPEFLRATFAGLQSADATAPGPDGGFSPVEQAWHLADLEREGFAVRIRRLLDEHEPSLPDFDGARVALERDYKARSLAEGLLEFERARRAAVAVLREVPAEAWARQGVQEGVGRVALCDIPAMMAEHDAAHRAEIDAWARARHRASH
jgi:hypothetical protein